MNIKTDRFAAAMQEYATAVRIIEWLRENGNMPAAISEADSAASIANRFSIHFADPSTRGAFAEAQKFLT